MACFTGLDRAHGVYLPRGPGASGKVTGSARTEHEQVSEELWQKHLNGEQGLGIVPITDDNTCKWGAIDVDKYDIDLPALVRLISTKELPLVTVRSKSGGAHLYLFLSEALPAKQIREVLESWAVVLGHNGVEIFPKQENLASKNDVGNWLNMPYFSLDSTVQYGVDKDGTALSPKAFLDLVEASLVSEEMVIPIQLESGDVLTDGPPCLQILLEQEIGEGGRNQILFNYGIYVRKRYSNEHADVEARLDEFNTMHVKPPLGSREVQEIVKHLMKKNYSYTCKQTPISEVCQQNICRTRRFGVGIDAGSGPPMAFGEFVKITTEPPFYILEVEGKRVELSGEELYAQDRFRKACMERIDKIPPRVKGPRWDGVLQELMKQVVIQSAPPDAGPQGQVKSLFEQWLAVMGLAEDQKELLTGRPWGRDGAVFFRSTYLLKYLRQHGMVNLTEQKLWKHLRRMSAGHAQFLVEGRNVQCWSMAVEELSDVNLNVPKVTDGAGEY